MRGIYRVENGRLVICVGVASGDGEDKAVEGKRSTALNPGPKAQLLMFGPG